MENIEDVEQSRHLHLVPDPAAETIPETSEESAIVVTEPEPWWIENLPPAIKENLSKPAWCIAGPDTAAWAEERFYEIFARKKVNDLQLENTIERLQGEIDRITRRNDERNKPFIGALNFFGGHLMDYALRLRQQDESVKSWKGLYMTVGTRASAEKFEITDKEKFAKWLTENNKAEWYELEVKPKKAVINKGVVFESGLVVDVQTGFIIEGVVAEPAKIVAKIEVEEEKDAAGRPVLHPVRQLYVFGEEGI